MFVCFVLLFRRTSVSVPFINLAVGQSGRRNRGPPLLRTQSCYRVYTVQASSTTIILLLFVLSPVPEVSAVLISIFSVHSTSLFPHSLFKNIIKVLCV